MQRQRETDAERLTDTDTKRQRDRETERQRDRKIERRGDTEGPMLTENEEKINFCLVSLLCASNVCKTTLFKLFSSSN
jgi:hypothetical protein